MKLILYITMLPLLLTLASPIDDTNEFSLINIYEMTDFDFEIADGSDTYSAILFSDSSNPLTIPVKNMTISESTISSPFIIKTVFKTHKSNPACLFSIVDDGAIKLQLCLTPAGEHITRITLQIEDLTKKDDVKEVSFTYAGDLAAWTRMLLHVEDAKVTLYMNCVNIDASEYSDKVEDIHISEKAVIHLGHDGNGDNFFEGVIEKIILYTEADDARLDYINTCSDTDSGDRGDDSSPENLEIFMDKPGSSGGDPIKGEKGDRGDPGPSIQGPPGPQGPEGPPGSPGKQGEQGTCSCSESVVSNLLKTMPEMRGPPGDRGLRGEMGDRGTPGLTGKQGDQGERGPQGLKGDMGASGADGSSGKDGTPGSKGEPGVDGDQGPLGPPGPMGPPGPPGPKCKETEEAKGVPMPGDKGETGPIGPPGPTGPRGHSGERGEPGLKGDTGDKGQQGHTGPQGPRGEKGHQGEAGIDGRPGEPGTHGRHGENGSKGDKGDRGEIGIPGPPTKLTSLLDPKDAEENAEIIKQLRGPQGDMGPPGEQGEKGDTGSIGPMGPSGKDGRHGNHGERGPRGPEGQIGPVGLTGPKGEAGEPGPPGNGSISTATAIKGPKGNKGDRGKVGPRGPTGPTGKRGPSGSAGPKGDAGPQGVIGPPGTCDLKDLIDEKGNSVLHGLMPKGEKGERGLDGKPGEIGPPGTPGQCPNSCATSTGPPGPPGPPGPAVTGPKGEPGGIVTEKTFYSFTDGAGETYGTHGHKNDEDDVYTAMTVIYRTTQALFKRTSSTPLGTLAYVLREKTLLLRVENGWQYVVMGSILATEPRDPYTTTTFRPQPSHIESSTPYPKPRQPNERTSIRVAALNEPYSGKIYFSNDRTGRNAANYACHRESRMFGFDGNFVAFLTNKVEDLRHLVKMNRDKELPVVNIHGEVLFERWADMFNGSGAVFAKSANLYSFNRKNVFIDPIWPQKAVWHGGTLDGIRSTDAFCEEWQSDSPTQYGLASPVEYSNKLLDQKKYSCDNKLIVLCVEATAARRRQRHLVSRSRDHLNRFQHDNNIFRL